VRLAGVFDLVVTLRAHDDGVRAIGARGGVFSTRATKVHKTYDQTIAECSGVLFETYKMTHCEMSNVCVCACVCDVR